MRKCINTKIKESTMAKNIEKAVESSIQEQKLKALQAAMAKIEKLKLVWIIAVLILLT